MFPSLPYLLAAVVVLAHPSSCQFTQNHEAVPASEMFRAECGQFHGTMCFCHYAFEAAQATCTWQDVGDEGVDSDGQIGFLGCCLEITEMISSATQASGAVQPKSTQVQPKSTECVALEENYPDCDVFLAAERAKGGWVDIGLDEKELDALKHFCSHILDCKEPTMRLQLNLDQTNNKKMIRGISKGELRN